MAQEEDTSDCESSSESKKNEQKKVPRRGLFGRLIRLETEQKQNALQDSSATHSILRKNLDIVPKELNDGRSSIHGRGNRPRSNLEGESLQRFDHHDDGPAFHKSKQLDDRQPTVTGRVACQRLHFEETMQRLMEEQKQKALQDSATHSILQKDSDTVPNELNDGRGSINGLRNWPRSNLEGENLQRFDPRDRPAFHKSKQLDDRRPTNTGLVAYRRLHPEGTMERLMEEQRLRLVIDPKQNEIKAANIMANKSIGPRPKHIPRCINGSVIGNGGNGDTTPCLPANLSSTNVNSRPTPSNQLYDERSMITGCRPRQRWLRSGDRGSSCHQAQVNLRNIPDLNLPAVPHSWEQSSSSSLVNSSSGVSLLSSMRSSQTKPPSNRSFHGNNNTPLSSETDKMVGMKRPCSFPRESSSFPPFHHNVPIYPASRLRPDELVYRSIGDAARVEARERPIRGHSNPNTSSEPEHDPREVDKEDRRLMGSFLTLAPPVAESSLGCGNASYEPEHDLREGENLQRFDHYDGPAFRKPKQLDNDRPTITRRVAYRRSHPEETMQRLVEEQRLRSVEDRKKNELKAANTMENMSIGPPPEHIPRRINESVVGNGGERDTVPCLPANLSSTDVNVRPTPPNQLYDEQRMITGRRRLQRWLRSGDRGSSSHQAQVNLRNIPDLNLPVVPHSWEQSSSSSLVNSSSGIPPSPSMLSSQIESPSNQSFPGNQSFWSSETNKMVGMKRPYSFSRESSPVPPFHRNVPTYAASRLRPDELVSRSIGDAVRIEARTRHIRGHSNQNTLSEPEHDLREVDKDDRRLMGSFLTLAPPVADSSLGNGNGNGDIAGNESKENLRSLSNFRHNNFSSKGSSNSNASSKPEHDPRDVDRDDRRLMGSFLRLAPPEAESSLGNCNASSEQDLSEVDRDDRRLMGSFLTLAPPMAGSSSANGNGNVDIAGEESGDASSETKHDAREVERDDRS